MRRLEVNQHGQRNCTIRVYTFFLKPYVKSSMEIYTYALMLPGYLRVFAKLKKTPVPLVFAGVNISPI